MSSSSAIVLTYMVLPLCCLWSLRSHWARESEEPQAARPPPPFPSPADRRATSSRCASPPFAIPWPLEDHATGSSIGASRRAHPRPRAHGVQCIGLFPSLPQARFSATRLTVRWPPGHRRVCRREDLPIGEALPGDPPTRAHGRGAIRGLVAEADQNLGTEMVGQLENHPRQRPCRTSSPARP